MPKIDYTRFSVTSP